MWPATVDVRIGAAPGNGTRVMSSFSPRRNSRSLVSRFCPRLMPAKPYFAGSARASAMNSCRVFAGTEGCTSTTDGDADTMPIGAKLLTASYCTFLEITGVIARSLVTHHQRVAVARCGRRHRGAARAARAADVLDIELLAERFAQLLRGEPGDHVGRSAGRIGHDDADRAGRIAARGCLRMTDAGRCEQKRQTPRYASARFIERPRSSWVSSDAILRFRVVFVECRAWIMCRPLGELSNKPIPPNDAFEIERSIVVDRTSTARYRPITR